MSRQPRFLAVDDLASMGLVVRDGLKWMDCGSAEQAENSAVAMSLLRASKVGFVAPDISTPNVNRFEFANSINGDGNLRGIPAQMVAAEAKKEDIAADQARVNDLLASLGF